MKHNSVQLADLLHLWYLLNSTVMDASPGGAVTAESKAAPRLLTGLPAEVQREILECLFIKKRVACVKRRPPPDDNMKKLKPLSKSPPPLIAVLLVSKTFVDRTIAVKAMLKMATIILKRAHFDKIVLFLDQCQRHLVEHLELNWKVEFNRRAAHGSKDHTTFSEIRSVFPNVKYIQIDRRGILRGNGRLNVFTDERSPLCSQAGSHASLPSQILRDDIKFNLRSYCLEHKRRIPDSPITDQAAIEALASDIEEDSMWWAHS